MITLHDLLTDMTYGEFAQLNMGNFLPNEHESEPDPKSYAQLSSHINLGLKALYSEFYLSAAELYLQQYEQIGTYTLSYDYAVSNTASTQPIKYIVDTAENPFQDNILKIEEAYDELGNLLFLNDATEDLSLFTPTYRSVQIPWPNSFNQVAIQYRATHPIIDFTALSDPTAIEVEVPHPLHEALMMYIASRVYQSLNNEGGQEGNDYFQKYYSKVADVRRQGLYVQPEPGNWRFAANGWV